MGELTLKNRICMAALTRQRCESDDLIPTKLHIEYYSQRAEAGFILTECLPVSDRSLAFPGEPGLFTDAHTEGWKQVVKGVHSKGGLILAQIWHAGRVSYATLQQGKEVWAPSPIAARRMHRKLNVPQELPHEMNVDEIKTVIKQFRDASERAKAAGFDGIQLYGGLIDQFLRSSANSRLDEYGGTVENRSKLCLQVIDQLIDVFGPGRVGIKITPLGRGNDMFDEDPLKLYTYLIGELEKRKIAFIELKDDDEPENFQDYGYPASKSQIADVYKMFRPLFSGVLIANNQFTPEKAIKGINGGYFDAVTFGRLFISNPDLVNRIKKGQELNTNWDVNTFYSQGPKGYTDYKTYEEWDLEKKQI